jgi:hypothetical protein
MTTIARPSVASLLLQATVGGNPLATGTGFVVSHDDMHYLVTNWHNVSGRRPDTGEPLHASGATPDALVILHNMAGALGQWKPVVEPVIDADGNALWLEHPVHGRKVDVVALPLSQLDGVELFTYDPWATDPAVAAGVAEGVNIVGFPFGLTGGGALAIWVRGNIATEPAVDFEGVPVFLIDSRTRPGQSGSPVIFYSAGGAVAMADGGTRISAGPVERLLGVYSGRINDQSDLGFVWKAAIVCEIIQQTRPRPEPVCPRS